MPSFTKSAAVAALALFAGASAQVTNSTALPSLNIGGWAYDGCFAVTAATGVLLDNSPYMTPERCTSFATNFAYARISGTFCYGADTVNGTSQVASTLCNTRCGGNPTEACGGSVASAKRQAVNALASVYQRVQAAAGTTLVQVTTNVYVDICLTCPGGLQTVAYCTPVTAVACGCASQTYPAIPVTTITTTVPCATCPASVSTVTLTVPSGVTPGTATGTGATVTVTAGGSTYCPGCAATVVVPPTATPTKAVFTGAAQNVKVGGGLLAGAAMVAALL